MKLSVFLTRVGGTVALEVIISYIKIKPGLSV